MSRSLLRGNLCLFILFFPLTAYAIQPGDSSPNFSFFNTNQSEVQLSDMAGKVILLDFWASWCPTCQSSLAWLKTLKNRYPSNQFEIVTVNLDAERENAEKLLNKLGATLSVAYDPKGRVAENYKIPGMPTSYLIDKQGKIISIHVGSSDLERDSIEKGIGDLVP